MSHVTCEQHLHSLNIVIVVHCLYCMIILFRYCTKIHGSSYISAGWFAESRNTFFSHSSSLSKIQFIFLKTRTTVVADSQSAQYLYAMADCLYHIGSNTSLFRQSKHENLSKDLTKEA